jgi:hypothetical protein
MNIALNKTRPFVLILFLLSLVWVNFNLYYFTHSHLDLSGNIVVHAHPYQNQDKQDRSTPTHSHSKTEFVFLAFIYHVLSTFTLFLFFVVYLVTAGPEIKFRFSIPWQPAEILSGTILKRGPPSFQQVV